MDDLEIRLGESFNQQVSSSPPLPHLAETVIVRGRQARRRRTTAAVLSLVVLAAGAVTVATQAGGASPLVPAGVPTSLPAPGSPDKSRAEADWVSGLLPKGSAPLSTTVFVGGKALFPTSGALVPGVEGVVYAATALPDGSVLVTTASPEGGNTVLNRLRADGTLDALAQGVTQRHAVDATGTRVAYGFQGSGRVVVAELATGRVLAGVTLAGPQGMGAPVGFAGDEVLMTTGDAQPFVRAWNIRTGAVREFGAALEDYRLALGATADGGWLALQRGDGSCFALVRTAVGRTSSNQCDLVFGGFSPDSLKVLIAPPPGQGGNTYTTTDIDGPGRGAAQLPYNGVLVVGWSDDSTLAAVVRAPDPKTGRSVLMVVTCPTSGTACALQAQLPDADSAYVVNARR